MYCNLLYVIKSVFKRRNKRKAVLNILIHPGVNTTLTHQSLLPTSLQIDLDSRHMGWVTSEVPGGDHHVIKVELKGPENTLRVRQVKVLGWKEGESIKIAGQISASVAQQKNCEAETLRVFRLITSQVGSTVNHTMGSKCSL